MPRPMGSVLNKIAIADLARDADTVFEAAIIKC
jgi:hypothetical protein